MKPTVSIIIPTYNAAKHIEQCLSSVLSQDYPSELTEVIVADNCSTDKTLSLIKKKQESVKIVKECTHPGSPYSARNRGIEQSTGEVIVLLDSDCVPEKSWLSSGINALLGFSVDIVGGKVKFTFKDKYAISEMYDSIMNIKMKESIEKHKYAKTANLFIKRKVFDKVGLFPEGVRSGYDVIWTRKATQQGFNLTYCNDAIVYKPARHFRSLVKKQWRVAKAQPVIWKYTGMLKSILLSLLKIFIPPSTIRRNIQEYGQPYMERYITQLFVYSILIRIIMIGGNIYGLASHWFSFKKKQSG